MGNEECGKPAVDFVTGIDDDGGEFQKWLCADHYDLLMRIHKIFKEKMSEGRDYKFRTPTPGKEID